MLAQRKADVAVIFNDFVSLRHRFEPHSFFVDFWRGPSVTICYREQGQGIIAQRLDRPQCISPWQLHGRSECVSFREANERRNMDAAAPPNIFDIIERDVGST